MHVAVTVLLGEWWAAAGTGLCDWPGCNKTPITQCIWALSMTQRMAFISLKHCLPSANSFCFSTISAPLLNNSNHGNRNIKLLGGDLVNLPWPCLEILERVTLIWLFSSSQGNLKWLIVHFLFPWQGANRFVHAETLLENATVLQW